MGYINSEGLSEFWNKVKSIIPTKVSDLTIDIDTDDVSETTTNRYVPAVPVASPETKFLNGNAQFVDITMGSGGYAANLYPTNVDSDVSGYKKLSYTNDAAETILSKVLTTTEQLFSNYVFDNGVGVTNIDAGIWSFQFYYRISSAYGTSKLRTEVFLRHVDNTETTLFSEETTELNNTEDVYLLNKVEMNNTAYSCVETDRLGFRVYGTTTTPSNVTVYTKIGDGYAAYMNTPLALRHSQLRGKNDEAAYQHVTTTEISNWNGGMFNSTDTHSALNTTNKTGVGAVNELVSTLGDIATALNTINGESV